MQVRVWQIDEDKELARRYLFADVDVWLKNASGMPIVERNKYRCIFEGRLPVKTAEDVFYLFNAKSPIGYKARSMSVSDVVEMNGTAKYCCTIGWRRCEFR